MHHMPLMLKNLVWVMCKGKKNLSLVDYANIYQLFYIDNYRYGSCQFGSLEWIKD